MSFDIKSISPELVDVAAGVDGLVEGDNVPERLKASSALM